MSETRGAVIIPTFNEGERIMAVAEAALGSSLTDEVIVVNDGSQDDTADLLEKYTNDFTVLTHTENRGKGESLDTGVRYARDQGHGNLVFLDGDLQGVDSSHVDTLLAPLEQRDVHMSIGYLGLRKTVVKKMVLNHWGALSGQRAIDSEVWDLLSDQDRRGFNVEAALNTRLRKAGMHHGIARVALDGLGHVGKRNKAGTLPEAVWSYLKTYRAALQTYVRIELEGSTGRI